ncbi:MAG TPA: hypothetical protein VLH86_01745 [Patescibacteria group bacterium]|nr:hypothetical protein [Patescibacteria group bacterium]
MKTTKISASKRARSAKPAKKAPARQARPLHKRILLHPFTVMVLLCAGVIVVGSTIQSFADSYSVTATVPAVLPSGPAVIGQPIAAQHFSSKPVTVTGTCPVATYVKLYRNATFSGVATCGSQTFQIQTDLAPGANQLEAKVYNVTNQEGPQSPTVVAYYDETTVVPAAPSSAPTTLQIANVESSSYKNGTIRQTSTSPTVTGLAPPYSDIVVTFHSEATYCKTKADGTGWWSCTLAQTLPVGLHRVDVTATTTNGVFLIFPTFQISVLNNLPNLLKPQSLPPLLIGSEYQFQTHYVGQPFTWSFAMHGGTAPYALTIDWGDDSQSNITRTGNTTFTLTHAYPEAKTYTIFAKGQDAKGLNTVLQLNAVVKGQSIGVASLTTSGPLASLFSEVRRYLWIVWPVYTAVVLMAFSYWLGEQEVYMRAKKRRLAHTGKGR